MMFNFHSLERRKDVPRGFALSDDAHAVVSLCYSVINRRRSYDVN